MLSLKNTNKVLSQSGKRFDNAEDIHRTSNYHKMYKKSLEDPEHFWAEIGKYVTWTKQWDKVLDNSNEPFTKWFVGGELNACYNAIDRHVKNGKGNKVALIYDSPLTSTSKTITYGELLDKVSRLAGALNTLGVRKGDRVVIYMPVLPETIMAMLAVCRLGAIHCVVFGGFASAELAGRIEHARPKVVIAANCGVEPNKIVNYKELLNTAIEMSSFKPRNCIIFERKNIENVKFKINVDMDVMWNDVINVSAPHPCVSVEANHPLYILYTSGTTGKPKGVQRPVGGHIATLAWSMQYAFGIRSDDVWWAASDFGWVVGHSYECYAPLLSGITTVVYEGKPVRTPDAGQYFRIIEKYKVNGLFTSPTAIRFIKKDDPDANIGKPYNISSLRHIFLAGELCDNATRVWAENVFKVPAINNYWQTETGHPITTFCVGLGSDVRLPKLSVGLPFAGYEPYIMRKDGSKSKPYEIGELVLKLPLPPGMLSTLYKSSEHFCSLYFKKFPGFYTTMDAGYIDHDGFIYITTRVDDIINVAGHRISTGAIEDVVMSHPDIIETAVVGVSDSLKGQLPLCLYIMKKNSDRNETAINMELIKNVRQSIGPVVDFKLSAAASDLPRTRSGKICRMLISKLANGELFIIPNNVENPSSFSDIVQPLRRLGYASNIHHSVNTNSQ